MGELTLEALALGDVPKLQTRPTALPSTRCGIEYRSNMRPSRNSMTSSLCGVRLGVELADLCDEDVRVAGVAQHERERGLVVVT